MKRILALTATALVLALAASGALPGTADASAGSTAFPPGRPTRVLVLGDSVMKGAEASVIAALPGREVVFDSEVNRSTGAGADIVGQRGADWDVAVVLLGHNDGGSPGVFQPAARTILDQLKGVPYVSWLTIHEVRPYYPGVNQFIAGLQGEYPNLHVGDWNAVASKNPGALSSDGLHLNGTGADLMAGVVTEQVEAGEQQFNASMLKLAQATTTTTTAPPTTTTTEAPTTTSTEAETTTSTTPTTAAPTTTAAPPAETAAPEQADDDDDILLPALGAAVLIAAAFAVLLVVRRRRARKEDQHTADTAG